MVSLKSGGVATGTREMALDFPRSRANRRFGLKLRTASRLPPERLLPRMVNTQSRNRTRWREASDVDRLTAMRMIDYPEIVARFRQSCRIGMTCPRKNGAPSEVTLRPYSRG